MQSALGRIETSALRTKGPLVPGESSRMIALIHAHCDTGYSPSSGATVKQHIRPLERGTKRLAKASPETTSPVKTGGRRDCIPITLFNCCLMPAN